MAQDKDRVVRFREAAPIPKMQPIKSGAVVKRGATIPKMRPVPVNTGKKK